MKNSLEIIIKQVRLGGDFKRGGRIRLAECLRQIVPDRWASVRKRSVTECFCVYARGYKVRVSNADLTDCLYTVFDRQRHKPLNSTLVEASKMFSPFAVKLLVTVSLYARQNK